MIDYMYFVSITDLLDLTLARLLLMREKHVDNFEERRYLLLASFSMIS